jgi:hypothetical protein
MAAPTSKEKAKLFDLIYSTLQRMYEDDIISLETFDELWEAVDFIEANV